MYPVSSPTQIRSDGPGAIGPVRTRPPAHLEAASAFPGFADVMVSDRVRDRLDAGMGIRMALNAFCGPGAGGVALTAGHLAAMRGADWGGMTIETKRRLLAMLSTLPSNWMPVDPDEASAAREMEPLHHGVALLAGEGASAFAGCGGRWRAFLADTVDRSGLGLRGIKRIPGLMAEASRDLCRVVVLPNVAHAAGMYEPDLASSIQALSAVAARSMYGGRPLSACITAQNTWHEGTAGLISRPLGPGSCAGEWPAMTRPWTAPSGLVLVPLTDGDSLDEEGRILDHCAATYGIGCLTGASHVVSVRRDGVPVSTAEFALNAVGGPRLRQHVGFRNAAPGPEASAALNAYRHAIAEGVLSLSPESVRLSSDHQGSLDVPDLETACGYDWRDPRELASATAAYDPLLPKRMRGLDAEGWWSVAQAVLGRAPDLAENEPAGGVPGP